MKIQLNYIHINQFKNKLQRHRNMITGLIVKNKIDKVQKTAKVRITIRQDYKLRDQFCV